MLHAPASECDKSGVQLCSNFSQRDWIRNKFFLKNRIRVGVLKIGLRSSLTNSKNFRSWSLTSPRISWLIDMESKDVSIKPQNRYCTRKCFPPRAQPANFPVFFLTLLSLCWRPRRKLWIPVFENFRFDPTKTGLLFRNRALKSSFFP